MGEKSKTNYYSFQSETSKELMLAYGMALVKRKRSIFLKFCISILVIISLGKLSQKISIVRRIKDAFITKDIIPIRHTKVRKNNTLPIDIFVKNTTNKIKPRYTIIDRSHTLNFKNFKFRSHRKIKPVAQKFGNDSENMGPGEMGHAVRQVNSTYNLHVSLLHFWCYATRQAYR